MTFEHEANDADELTLDRGDTIEVICEVEDGWWRGKSNGKTGLFPSNFVELVDEKDVTQGKDKHDEMQSKCFVVNVFDTVNMS